MSSQRISIDQSATWSCFHHRRANQQPRIDDIESTRLYYLLRFSGGGVETADDDDDTNSAADENNTLFSPSFILYYCIRYILL